MKLRFIGSGSAFTMENYHSNMVLESEDKKLLIDCGGDVRFALRDQLFTSRDIDDVYISHLHNDHIGGLEWLAFATYFDPGKKRPGLYAVAPLMSGIWRSLKGGLASLQAKQATLETYFNTHRLRVNNAFMWQSVDFMPIQTIHIMDGYSIVSSFGLMINNSTLEKPRKIFITTDTQNNPNQLKDFYNEADIIFHDCETSNFKSGVHAHYSELEILDDETKKKMWLYHYQDGKLPDAKKDGFAGFVKRGQSFTI